MSKLWCALFAQFLLLVSFCCNAASIASYPEDWRSWPVANVSMVPGKDVVLPEETPLFIQEAVAAYNWINEGKGTKLTTYVHPDKIDQYATHGPYSDGITVVGVYETPGVVFVTEHLAGEPIYGTYDTNGLDISSQHPTFEPEFCGRCHTAYQDICINGTCSVPVIDLFEDK
ncbi:hypothetical protein ACVFI8_04450 [Agarivorans sp. MS3-6]|uniref:hypothetical protein n=1 Tax=Agarivorans sp. TSD2052 TaxID=2937286 RepID=UPI00200F1FDD|nr:hypothetical protein [Agarivorans sp. TSD2052]UPW19735.1 hypothetical protein M0C34_05490 [Agarivorans sp. TSD2052]